MAKVLAWTTLGLTLLFVILALTAVFGWSSLGGSTAARLATARMLFYYGGLPALGIAILLAVVLLALAAFQSPE